MRGKSCEVVTQLGAQESASGPALQEFLAAFGVFAFRVRLVINQLPWTSRFRGERGALRMLRQPPLQVRRKTNVEPIVFSRMQEINVEHPLVFYPESRVRRSLLRGHQCCKAAWRSFTRWSSRGACIRSAQAANAGVGPRQRGV